MQRDRLWRAGLPHVKPTKISRARLAGVISRFSRSLIHLRIPI
jgi:hypothetical protein